MELNILLSKFKDGEKRFQENALFNKCILCITEGGDPLKIIDDVLLIVDSQQEQLHHIIKNGTMNIITPS